MIGYFVLQSIYIAGDILDWDEPVEIDLSGITSILTGRNGSGKTLVGNIIKTCTDYLSELVKSKSSQETNNQLLAERKMHRLFENVGVEKVIFKFENKIYEQYNNDLFSNLPLLMTLDPDVYTTCKQHSKAGWDLDITARILSNVEIAYSNTSEYPITNVHHELIVEGNVFCLWDVEEYELLPHWVNEDGDLDIFHIINLKNEFLFDEMIHEAVEEMRNYFHQYGLNVIVFNEDEFSEDEKGEHTNRSLCIYQPNLEILKDLYESKKRERKIPLVSHHHPDFQFPSKHEDESFFERIESFGLKDYLEKLSLTFITTNREIVKEIEFKHEKDFENENFGYYDMLKVMGEKFGLPDNHYDPLKLPGRQRIELSNFWKPRIREVSSSEGEVMFFRRILEPDFINGLSDNLKSNLPKFVLYYWWNITIPPWETGIRTQIILRHYFGIKNFDLLSPPIPSGIENLAYLLEEVRNNKNSIIFIDEPEISLHIDWQSEIIEVLRSIAGKNTRLIFTTHSPDIVVNNLQYVCHLPPQSS